MIIVQAGNFSKINKRAGYIIRPCRLGIFKKKDHKKMCRLEKFPKSINLQDVIRECRLKSIQKNNKSIVYIY